MYGSIRKTPRIQDMDRSLLMQGQGLTQESSRRTNVICISDEAHRSQINLDQKIKLTKDGVEKTYGFAKHLNDSLPNATYVGFTGTPIDATMDVFGEGQ